MLASDLQLLAETRQREARSLLHAGFPSGAFYLAGYSVEAAIKVCIAKATKLHEFPDQKRATAAWRHELNELLNAAGLGSQFQEACRANPSLQLNWSVVKDWKVESRYATEISEQMAQDMIAAIIDPRDGILTWLKQHW